jgi:hypothetical protein
MKQKATFVTFQCIITYEFGDKSEDECECICEGEMGKGIDLDGVP